MATKFSPSKDMQVFIDTMPFITMVVDEEHTILLANKALKEFAGRDAEDCVGCFCARILHKSDIPHPDCPLVISVKSKKPAATDLYEKSIKSWMRSAVYPTGLVTDTGKQVFLHLVQNINAEKAAAEEANTLRETLEHRVAERTEELKQANKTLTKEIEYRKRAEEQAKHLAYVDPVTGLANRLLFNQRLGQAFRLAERYKRNMAVIMIDLDHFKKVNDGFGHPVGDDVLIETGRRIGQIIRGSDTLARMGGDEFMVILSEVAARQEATLVIRRIQQALRETIKLPYFEQAVTASLGYALFPDDGEDTAALVHAADKAMYKAKKQGRDTFFPV